MRTYFNALVLGAAVLGSSSQSYACLVAAQWYDGWWDCRIDGRPSNVVWETACVPVSHCDGDICSSSYEVQTKGWFREANSRWFRLIKNSSTGQSIHFTYTGDNTPWFLRYDPGSQTASGHTTWQGSRYPLSCRKM